MQVRQDVVEFVSINVMDYLSRLSARHLPVLPLTTASFGAISQTERFNHFVGVPVTFLHRRSSNFSNMIICNRGNHLVTSPIVFAVWEFANLLFVGIKSITMIAKHLVVAHAQTLRYSRPFAVLTRYAYRLSSPCIVNGSMPLQPLVVHEAKAIGRMLSTAALNITNSVFKRCHHPSMLFPISYIGINNRKDNGQIKIIGNSWAVPKFTWLGRRIAALMPAAQPEEMKEAA